MTSATTSQLDVPSCDECETPLRTAGLGAHTYWTCGYCGQTLVRDA